MLASAVYAVSRTAGGAGGGFAPALGCDGDGSVGAGGALPGVPRVRDIIIENGRGVSLRCIGPRKKEDW